MAELQRLVAAVALGGVLGAASLLLQQRDQKEKKGAQSKTLGPTTDASSVLPTLYVFDYSGYCARTRMIMGLKKIPYELVFVAYDDAVTPKTLVGVKQVPILRLPSGEAFLESLDIVRYVDTNYGDHPILEESAQREDIKQWIRDTVEIFRRLYNPRFHASVLPEFARFDAREYYRIKKEKPIGPFENMLANTPELLAQANEQLLILDSLLHSSRSVNTSLSYDDIDIFCRLRGLTLVKGVKWPKKLREYMDSLAQASDVRLFDSMAC